MDENKKINLEEYFMYSDKSIYEILRENRKDKSKPQLKDFIKYAREKLGYTQEEFAKMLEIKQNTLSRYENGVRAVPLILFMDLAHELGYDMFMKQRKEKHGGKDELVRNYEDWQKNNIKKSTD